MKKLNEQTFRNSFNVPNLAQHTNNKNIDRLHFLTRYSINSPDDQIHRKQSEVSEGVRSTSKAQCYKKNVS